MGDIVEFEHAHRNNPDEWTETKRKRQEEDEERGENDSLKKSKYETEINVNECYSVVIYGKGMDEIQEDYIVIETGDRCEPLNQEERESITDNTMTDNKSKAKTMKGREIVNALCKFYNSMKGNFYWHDGNMDEDTEFNGLHVHMIEYCGHKLSMNRQLQNMKKTLKRYDIDVKTEKARKIEALVYHYELPPRRFLASNNRVLLDITTQARERVNMHGNKRTDEEDMQEEDEEDEMSEKKVKESKAAKNIDLWYMLMEKSGKTSQEDIADYIDDCKERSLKKLYRELIMSNKKDESMTEARREYMKEKTKKKESYIDILNNMEMEINDKYYSIKKMRNMLMKWSNEQRIGCATFLVQLYIVLNKKSAKRNTFMLQGAASAGKTCWMNAIKPDESIIGRAINSKDFGFQECVDKDIILINECTIDSKKSSDDYKQVMEGQNFMANRKNKNGCIIKRTPVIITCNELPWKNMMEDKEAFEERVYCYKDLKYSKVLKDEQKNGIKRMNPELFINIFNNIQRDTEQFKDVEFWDGRDDITNEAIKSVRRTFIELEEREEEGQDTEINEEEDGKDRHIVNIVKSIDEYDPATIDIVKEQLDKHRQMISFWNQLMLETNGIEYNRNVMACHHGITRRG